MGYLTTITVYNDALDAFKKDPKKFGEAIINGITQANNTRKQQSVPFGCFANYITVEYSRDADDTTVFLHTGNSLTAINKWDVDFENLVKTNPELARTKIKRAKVQLKMAEELLKKSS